MVQTKNGPQSSGTQDPLPSSMPAQSGKLHPHVVSEFRMVAGAQPLSPYYSQLEGGVRRGKRVHPFLMGLSGIHRQPLSLYPIRKNLVTWPCLAAKDAGECNVYLGTLLPQIKSGF